MKKRRTRRTKSIAKPFPQQPTKRKAGGKKGGLCDKGERKEKGILCGHPVPGRRGGKKKGKDLLEIQFIST